MANPEHLAKLREKIKAWNKWRKENPQIKPDLIGVDLVKVKLIDYNFQDTNFSNANFTSSNLYGADLSNASLQNANLYLAQLFDTNLRYADLRGAILQEAQLYGTILEGANLEALNLENLKLDEVILNSANLFGANLKKVQALGTNFDGAILTGACIEDWNINSKTNFNNVKCDYIYLKSIYCEQENKWIFTDRVPHDPDKIFAPREFAKRYQKILETVNLYFGEGIDWQVFLNSFQKLQEEEKIKIADGQREIPIVQGIENTGDGSFLIKIGVSPDTDKGEIEKSFWHKYQPMLEAAEKRYQLQLNAKQEQIDIYRQQNTELLEIIKLKASQPINVIQQQGDNQVAEKRDINIEQGNYNESIKGNYYEQKGNIGIGHMSGGEIKGNAKVAGLINEATQQDLAEAATEIKQLLDQLSQTYPTKTTSEKMAVGAKLTEEIENNPTRWQKLINVIKVMGIEALAEAVDNPIFNIAKAGIEAALEFEL